MCNEATELLKKKHCPFCRNLVHISQNQCIMPQSIDKNKN